MSLLHNHYSSTGQDASDLLANMFITEIPPEHQRPKPSRQHTPSNTHKLIRSYDHSAPTSPVMSRRGSTSSISSTKSEPTWESQLNRARQASTASTKTNDSTKSLTSFFKKDKSKKEKEKKKVEQIVLGSRHAAAVKTKMMLDPQYREMREKHQNDGSQGTKTAGVRGTEHSSHLTAAEQEMRHPHSGPATMHSSLDMPALTRIVSGDEEDPETDEYERERREWTIAHFPELAKVNEALSSQGHTPPASAPVTPQGGTPLGSRDSSPNRTSINGLRPIMPKAKHSWGGGYKRNERGRWTKKDSEGGSPPIPRSHPPPHPEVLAKGIAEQLHVGS